MMQRRLWMLLSAVAISLLVVIVLIRPGADERQSMTQRNLIESAETKAAAGDAEGAIADLSRALEVRADRKVRLRLLTLLAQTGRWREHSAIVARTSAADLGEPALVEAQAAYAQAGLATEAAMATAKRTDLAAAALKAGKAMTTERLLLVAEADDRALAARAWTTIGASLAPNENPYLAMRTIKGMAAVAENEAPRFVRRWLGSNPSQEAAQATVDTFISLGRAPEAARLVERLGPHHPIYRKALAKAAQVSAEDRQKLTHLLLEDLQGGAPSALHELLAFGDLDLTIARLERSGAWRTPTVRPALLSHLRKTGRDGDLRRLLLSDAARGVTGRERVSLANELVSAGLREEAIGLLKAGVFGEGPAGPAWQALSYQWSLPGAAPDGAWLAQRLQQARAIDPWIDAIEKAWGVPAAEAAILRAFAALNGPAKDAATLRRARYLGWREDYVGLRSLLDRFPSALRAGDPHEWAALACAAQSESALAALQARSDKAVACLAEWRLGRAQSAAARGDRARALALFETVARERPAILSAEHLFIYADLLEQGGQKNRASPLYAQALAKIEPRHTAAFRASILRRMNREGEARAVLKEAVATGEEDSRVALAEVLSDEGDYTGALALLCADASCDDHTSPAASRPILIRSGAVR